MKLTALLWRDLVLVCKGGNHLLYLFAYLVMVVAIFAFGMGTDHALWQEVSGAVIWVSVLLFSHMAMAQFFYEDFQDGSLEQMLLQGVVLEYVVFALLLIRWAITFIPLIIFVPLLMLMMQMPLDKMGLTMVSLFLGTPIIACISVFVSSLSLGAHSKSVLFPILHLPLSMPAVIFATGLLTLEADVSAILPLLLGLLLGVLPLSVFASAASIRLLLRGSCHHG